MNVYEAKERRVDYRYMSGVVGQYKGSDIFVVPEKDFKLGRSKKDRQTWFALADGKKEEMPLISGGMWIGNMSPQGLVDLFPESQFWPPEKKKVVEKVVFPDEMEEPVKPVEVPKGPWVGEKTIDDYLAGETLADRFLKQMGF